MLKPWIYRLGSQPQLSVKRFLLGLGLFAISLGFIALGFYHNPLWQLLGLGLLAVAVFFAAWGYLGILANRLAQFLNHSARR